MGRVARVVAAGYPHHVIQRGNRRQKVYFNESDRVEYLRILKEQSEKYGLKVWAYCLMENHVHLIVVPESEESLGQGIGETHKRYTRMINFREKWRGYLWEGRFKSFILDEVYLYAAIRYVERNPVRARIVQKAENYQWSSAEAHVNNVKDPILSDFYLTQEIEDWRDYLSFGNKAEEQMMRQHSFSGRPWGTEEFVVELEMRLGRILRRWKPGPRGNN